MTATLNADQILQAALVLPEGTRASLASDLLASLTNAPFTDLADETYQEVLRRDAGMNVMPSSGLTGEEFRAEIVRHRGA